MKLVRYSPDQKSAWDAFVENSKNGIFMFKRDYMDYHADRFVDHSLIVLDDDDRMIALLPANEREGVLYSHQGLTFGGFVTDISMKSAKMLEVFSHLNTYLRQGGFSKLVYKAVPYIYHKQPAQEDIYALFRNQASVFRVDVSTTINLSNKISFADLRKRGAKKAAKAGVALGRSNDFSQFISVLSGVLEERHGAKPVHSVQELELLASRFPENIKLYTGSLGDKILAGVLVFEYQTVVHAQYIAASPEGRDCGALDAVFSYLINDIYPSKQYFDFGISTEDAGMFLNEGLINQKEGFGGRAIVHQFFDMNVDAVNG